MKFRSFLSLLAVVVLVLLLSSAGGFYWLVGRNPLRLLSSEQGVPGAAIFVPKQAPALASLLLNPDQLETLQLVSTPLADRRKVRQELAQLKQSILATTGLDYKRDVQPWLGQEITLAVTTLDVDRDATNGQQPGYLVAIATQEPQRSREFLELFWQKRAIAGSDLVFEQYNGVKIIAANAPAPTPERLAAPRKPKPSKYRLQLEEPKAPLTPAPVPSLASAAVGDRFILFANYPKVLREAINNVQAPDLSLERSTVFTQAIEALTQPRMGLTFIDLSKLTPWLGSKLLTATTAQQQDATGVEPTVEKTPIDQTLMIGFAPNQYGLLAETALLSAPPAADQAISTPLLSQMVGALQYMPGRSAIAASGTNLDRLWTQLTNGLAPYETASQLVNQPLQALQSRWQLDLPADVFSWVKGEYALAMVPPDIASTAGTRQPDWLFAAQRPQSEADQQAIAHLDDLARQQGLNVGPLTIGDRTVSAWTRLTTATKTVSQSLNLQADVQGVHASLGNYELFATSITAMDTALNAIDHSLLTDGSFQRTTAALLRPNNGYLYLDWDASQVILEQRFPVLKVLELAAKPLFSHLRSLTLSSYGSQAGIQRGGALIQLKGR